MLKDDNEIPVYYVYAAIDNSYTPYSDIACIDYHWAGDGWKDHAWAYNDKVAVLSELLHSVIETGGADSKPIARTGFMDRYRVTHIREPGHAPWLVIDMTVPRAQFEVHYPNWLMAKDRHTMFAALKRLANRLEHGEYETTH